MCVWVFQVWHLTSSTCLEPRMSSLPMPTLCLAMCLAYSTCAGVGGTQ